MYYNHIAIGGGVIGMNSTLNFLKKLLSSFSFSKKIIRKKYLLAIIDNNIENIPGGIGYGRTTSKFGFFNNPLRLSQKAFQKFYSDKKY